MEKLINKVLLVIFLTISTNVYATTQALLIGVGQYQDPSFNLEGPKNDVLALEQVLIEKWGFNKNTVTKLIDAQASHDEIIKSLKSLIPDDFKLTKT